MSSAVPSGLARYQRFVVFASLLAVAAVAWLYLWMEASRMASMDGDAGMLVPRSSDAAMLLMTFTMWSVMMVGMMLPSATPAILLHASLTARSGSGGSTLPLTWVFVAGYLAVWTGFSLAATVLQTTLELGRLLTPGMSSASAVMTGVLLIAAGVYQWLPVKDACLRTCRAPLQFFMFRWRPRACGAFRMGAEHGLICLGCCWALMLLLFTAGVMNLLWVAAIAAFVFIEKLVPGGQIIGRLGGIGLAVTGVVMIIGIDVAA